MAKRRPVVRHRQQGARPLARQPQQAARENAHGTMFSRRVALTIFGSVILLLFGSLVAHSWITAYNQPKTEGSFSEHLSSYTKAAPSRVVSFDELERLAAVSAIVDNSQATMRQKQSIVSTMILSGTTLIVIGGIMLCLLIIAGEWRVEDGTLRVSVGNARAIVINSAPGSVLTIFGALLVVSSMFVQWDSSTNPSVERLSAKYFSLPGESGELREKMRDLIDALEKSQPAASEPKTAPGKEP